MKKVFVLVPFLERTNEELTAIREDVLNNYIESFDIEAELSLPQGKRLTGDLEAMFAADTIIKAKHYIADPVCSIVEQAASVYGKEIYDLRDIIKNREKAESQNEAAEPQGETE